MSSFQRNLGWSAAAHVALLVLLLLFVKFAPSPKPVKAKWFEITPNPPVSSVSHAAISPRHIEAPPSPQPQAEETPSPSPPIKAPPDQPPPPVKDPSPPEPQPKPVVQPKPKPLPEEPPTKPLPHPHPPPKQTTSKPVDKPKPSEKPPKVVVNKTIVRRPVGSASSAVAVRAPTQPKATSFNASKFASNLLNKFQDSGNLVTPKSGKENTTGSPVQADEFASYYNHIFQEMYGAWHPPFGLPEGLSTKILIRIEKTGVISKVSLASSSGNPLMDESALAAANRVNRLQPLPTGLGNPHAEIIVNFKIQKT